jgi:hypothetical protein
MKIAFLLHCLLKTIHEWMAVIEPLSNPSPTFVEPWGPHQIFRKVIFGVRPGRNEAASGMSRWSRMGSRVSVAQFRVLGGCGDLLVNLSQHRMQ